MGRRVIKDRMAYFTVDTDTARDIYRNTTIAQNAFMRDLVSRETRTRNIAQMLEDMALVSIFPQLRLV
jgi:hypothetical protein